MLTLSLVRPTIVGMGGYVFSKIHCTRSERAMIYLNVSADRGKTADSSSIFFRGGNGLMLAIGAFEARKGLSSGEVMLREKRSMAIYQLHLRSQ